MRAIVAVLCGLVLAGVAAADVTVTGVGRVTYTPDLATIDVEFAAEGKDTAETWKRSSDYNKQLCDMVEKQGVAAKDIKTSSSTINPRFVYPKGGNEERKLVGYTVTAHLSVTVRDVAKLSKLLDVLAASGYEPRLRVDFTSTKREDWLEQARMKAIEDARRRAVTYAGAARLGVGKVKVIEELGESLPSAPTFTYGAKGGGAAVTAGDQEVTVRVRVVFALTKLE